MRAKQESWQSVESSLSERALRAESAAEMADHRKALLEEQVGGGVVTCCVVSCITTIHPIDTLSTHPTNTSS